MHQASLTHLLSTCRSVGQSVGDCPELGAKLQVFMSTFFSSLPSEHRGTEKQKPQIIHLSKALTHFSWLNACHSKHCVCFVGRMLLQMIQQLCSKHWCAAPLLFFSQALSKLPPNPLLGIDGLTALRYLIMVTVRQAVL